MPDDIKVLEAAIQSLFPHVKAMRISPAMELGAIPEWDAAAADGLQAFIALRLGVTVPGAYLREGTTIGDLLDFIRGTGAPGEPRSAAAGAHPAGPPEMGAPDGGPESPEPTTPMRS
jgi:hypothetical protein